MCVFVSLVFFCCCLNYSMWLVFTLNPSCVLKFLFSFLFFFILVCYLDLLSYTCIISNSSNYEYIVRFGAQTFMSLMTCGSFYNTFIMCFFLLLSCIVHITLCVLCCIKVALKRRFRFK